jgi:DNA-binding MarR family transcriptional regulator
MAMPIKDTNYELVAILSRTLHLINRARQEELNQCGISLRNSGILNMIVRLGKSATPVAIARELFMEHHSVSETLRKMEAQGLVARIRDLKRKNLIRLELTPAGYDAYLKCTVRESIDDIMSVLTEAQKLELWSLLSKLRTKAMGHMGIKNTGVYPPSNPAEL